MWLFVLRWKLIAYWPGQNRSRTGITSSRRVQSYSVRPTSAFAASQGGCVEFSPGHARGASVEFLRDCRRAKPPAHPSHENLADACSEDSREYLEMGFRSHRHIVADALV